MRLNHLDLHVPDVDAAVAFLTAYLGCDLVDTRANGGLAILTDHHGLEIVLSQPVEKLGSIDQMTIGRVSYHIGFITDDRASVDRIHAAMLAGGVDLPHGPREIRGGYLFYCYAPGNILIEIGARPLLT